jgi:riboflavin kinase/FMN adenylyltransferase
MCTPGIRRNREAAVRVLEWARFTGGPPDRDLMERGSAMTVGVFDGVHRGHQALIERIVRPPSPVPPGLEPVIISFRGNPKTGRQNPGGAIYTLDQKLAIFEQLGAVLTVLIDFSRNFSKMRGREFINLLKDRGNLRYLVVGSDFHCGYRLDTGAAAIKEMNNKDGVLTEVVPPVVWEGVPVSSSRIRAAIAAGNLAEAAALLGRPFDPGPPVLFPHYPVPKE